jgi:dipeptidyl aminopeptidase/acylaminoacyl peptidase
MTFFPRILLLVTLVSSAAPALSTTTLRPYRPTPAELRASYRRADGLRSAFANKALNLTLVPHWYAHDRRFWFQLDLAGGSHQYIAVDEDGGLPSPAFDHSRLAQALSAKLGQAVDPGKLPLGQLRFEEDPGTIRFNAGGKGWTCNLETYELKEAQLLPGRRRPPYEPWVQDLFPADKAPIASPDGAWTARCDGTNVLVKSKGGTEYALTSNGTPQAYFQRVEWRSDSKKLIAVRAVPGDRKPVYLIQSSPPGGGRAVLHTRVYDLPGDKTDAFDLWLLDPASKEVTRVQSDPVDYGDLAGLRWEEDKKHFTYEKMDRGFQRWRLIEVDAETGTTRALIDEKSKTFIDSTSQYIHYCGSGEVIFRSERDGWGHLYLYSPEGKLENQITKGQWVVRGVDAVDDKARTLVFHASGMNAGEDPYFNHYFKVNFDGTGLTPLTPEPGDHSAELSPDGTALIDTCSTVGEAPVHTLRRVSDGAMLAKLAKADIEPLLKAGWHAPEVFVAKGRDGKTDIWGLIYRPSNFNPHRSYPVIEDIYAGPQDSFVPKSFATYRSEQALAELGFIVVKVDGMGTRNRGKAFQDVCYKNLADSGFPDRILWMKAAAQRYRYMDIDRVGVFGTSAGGQESTAALLFHPEFYKVGVSSCGCHDNRMDKLWWNEQWMGYPVGPEYAEQSNITNASKLKGKLLLFVSELDTNVPPESTMRLVNALIQARKEFEMLVTPNADHGQEGPFGERKRRDFFVHNLLGVEPPDWNKD